MNTQEHDKFHKEFADRIDAENARQNRRLDLLEKSVNHINDLTISVEKMAINMGNMLDELKKQGERLEELEKEPVETYNQVKQAIITTIAGVIVGGIAAALLTLL
ncbi:hypothetical protein D3Z36_15820 [Lachnospiraceae bacterium]|nr:hypothetical protein [Lachnospiraceae bacterium]